MITKKRIKEIIDVKQTDDKTSHFVDSFIILLVFLNIIAIALESVDSFSQNYHDFFVYFEVFSVMVFTIEYLIRIWVCTEDEEYSHPIWGRIRFMFTPLMILDLCAILPFYLAIFVGDSRFLRVLRLARILRLTKLARYYKSFGLLGDVLYERREDLILTLFFISILLVFSSFTIYFFEHEAQPDAFPNIPAALWWGVITLTTIGYGDIYPITLVGKIFTSIIAITGLGLFALPAGILGAGFIEQVQKRKEEREKAQKQAIKCPHCGEFLPDDSK